MQVSCGGCHTIVRARSKDKSNGEVSSDSEDEKDPLKTSGNMKKGLLATALSYNQGVDSVDFGGSLSGSFDGSARGRRRQREVSHSSQIYNQLSMQSRKKSVSVLF